MSTKFPGLPELHVRLSPLILLSRSSPPPFLPRVLASFPVLPVFHRFSSSAVFALSSFQLRFRTLPFLSLSLSPFLTHRRTHTDIRTHAPSLSPLSLSLSHASVYALNENILIGGRKILSKVRPLFHLRRTWCVCIVPHARKIIGTPNEQRIPFFPWIKRNDTQRIGGPRRSNNRAAADSLSFP